MLNCTTTRLACDRITVVHLPVQIPKVKLVECLSLRLSSETNPDCLRLKSEASKSFLSLNESQEKTHCKKRILPMLVLGQADRRRQASTIFLRFNSCNSGITDSNCKSTTSSEAVRPLARSESGNFPFLVQKQ